MKIVNLIALLVFVGSIILLRFTDVLSFLWACLFCISGFVLLKAGAECIMGHKN